MNRFDVSTVVWMTWLAMLAVFELSAVLAKHLPFKVPWSTLSEWTWRFEKLSPVLPWVVLAGLAVLLVHLSPRLRP